MKLRSVFLLSIWPWASIYARLNRKEVTSGLREGSRTTLYAARPQEHHWKNPSNVNVRYGHHPFQRQLQLNNNSNEHKGTEHELQHPNAEPLRISFLTDPLISRKGEDPLIDADIELIINQTLPALAAIWTQRLSVYPVTSPIEVDDDTCYTAFKGLIGDTKFVQHADLVIVVGGSDELRTPDGYIQRVCQARSLAVASHCVLDQFDRPVVGFINFCLPLVTLRQENEPLIKQWSNTFLRAEGKETPDGYNSLESNKGIKDTLTIAQHEMVHILGMDYGLYKYFRDPETGEPLTPRPFQKREVTCVDGISQMVEVPSERVVQWNRTLQGKVYFDIVTPRVATVVRSHFGCPELKGARLENQHVGNVCFGGHWDERLFLTEIMGPAFSGLVDVLSPLTLALLEDSGWYKVNYKNATMSPFGRGMGCDFVNSDCIVNDKVPDYGRGAFCDRPIEFDGEDISQQTIDTGLMCDPSHTAFALCDLVDAPTVPEEFLKIPKDPVHYFSNKDWVSPFSFSDFCPIPIRKVGVHCQHSHDHHIAAFSGEEVGPASRCINGFPDFASSNQIRRPACMRVECDQVTRKVLIGSGESKQTCDFDGQNLKLENNGVLECPKALTICPHLFCPSSCSARGICDWSARMPTCQCFDEGDMSDDCSGEYIPTAIPSSTTEPSMSPVMSQKLSALPSSLEPTTLPTITVQVVTQGPVLVSQSPMPTLTTEKPTKQASADPGMVSITDSPTLHLSEDVVSGDLFPITESPTDDISGDLGLVSLSPAPSSAPQPEPDNTQSLTSRADTSFQVHFSCLFVLLAIVRSCR